jgi:hypothetical protein
MPDRHLVVSPGSPNVETVPAMLPNLEAAERDEKCVWCERTREDHEDRLCDSDVMVMLDTPSYFGARWTAAEIGRALAKKIAVLGVVWPGHTPERLSQLREPIYLENADLVGSGGPLTAPIVERICIAVERLRSRSLAIRHAAIAGALRSAIEEIGGSVAAIGAHRGMKIVLADGREVLMFPAVGVPTAENLYDVAQSTSPVPTMGGGAPVLVYDRREPQSPPRAGYG